MVYLRWPFVDGAFTDVPWWVPVVAGSTVLFGGLLVLFVPQILVVLASVVISSVGLSMVGAGLSLRSSQGAASDGVPRGDRRFEHGFAGQGPRVAWFRRWEVR